MELITNIIIEYLKHNKRLVVPKLGAFIVKQPGNKILFSELMRGEDNTLRSLLVAYGMSDIEANGAIDRMVFEIRHAVGKGDSYTIENLGVFSAGDNNNIKFKQHHEPITIGGNIRPPFDTLKEAKRKMRRTHVSDDVALPKPKMVLTNRQATRDIAEESINMTKPDSYLRGLRYENKKDKGRDADHHRAGIGFVINRRMMAFILILILLAVGIFLVWYLWPSDGDVKHTAQSVVVEHQEVVEPRDTLPNIMSDSTSVGMNIITTDSITNLN